MQGFRMMSRDLRSIQWGGHHLRLHVSRALTDVIIEECRDPSMDRAGGLVQATGAAQRMRMANIKAPQVYVGVTIFWGPRPLFPEAVSGSRGPAIWSMAFQGTPFQKLDGHSDQWDETRTQKVGRTSSKVDMGKSYVPQLCVGLSG